MGNLHACWCGMFAGVSLKYCCCKEHDFAGVCCVFGVHKFLLGMENVGVS